MNIQALYETDFNSWIQENIALLKQSRFNEIDARHIIEELEDMGKSNKHALKSRLIVLIAHLLKWQYQKEKQSSSWESSIKEQRRKLTLLLKDFPSLKNYFNQAIQEGYEDAVEWAADETGFKKDVFPSQCPYTSNQLLDKDFYP
jgi:cell division protein ZapA (FtsZ GTPase activity inhibitor)